MSLAAEEYDVSRGYAFFTLSILIDSDEINALLGSSGPERVWRREKLSELQTEFADSQALQRAINPMFDDIADRERNLFVKDFLLDTPNRVQGTFDASRSPASAGNVCAEIELRLPGQVHWATEGSASLVALGSPIVFSKVLCRAFWMVHSNAALSYHLSFEVPYQRELADHYGLSMLQKAFHPTEGTEWVLGEKGWMAVGDGQEPRRLLDFIEGLFESHSAHLFGTLASRSGIGATDVPAKAARAWQRLVLHDVNTLASAATLPSSWHDASRRRLLVLIRDEQLFDIINRVRNHPSILHKLEPLRALNGAYSLEMLRAHFAAQATAMRIRQQAEMGAGSGPGTGAGTPSMASLSGEELAAAVFLSGFFQNVVDFVEQDGLEIHDGISPLYPNPQDGAANDGYFVYATPKVVFEVVSSSRSLDRAGRRWLGTCPYLFLVHIMALHNEGILHAYELNVSGLVDELETMGIRSESVGGLGGTAMPLGLAFEKIKRFRLRTFEQVHKHLSFNVFRYETEQIFFRRIEDVRGTGARQAYWSGVLEQLTQTVDALKEHRLTNYGLRLSWLGFVLALSGVLQVWFAIFPGMVKPSEPISALKATWSLGVGLGGAVAATVIFIVATRHWFESSRPTTPNSDRGTETKRKPLKEQ